MLLKNNVRLAIQSLRSSRARSLLTMFGIIIGVASVITMVSLGEGVRQQVNKQVKHLGPDVITIRPGRLEAEGGALSGANLLSNYNTSTLSDQDLETVGKTKGVSQVTPLLLISGVASVDGHKFDNGITIATNETLPSVLKQRIEFGEFYTIDDEGRNVAVIGQRVARELFRENVPIGKSFSFRGQDFIVRGVFDSFDSNPLTPGLDFNSAIFIPDVTAKTLTKNNAQIFQIFAKPDNPKNSRAVLESIRQNLLKLHGGQQDFTILTQEQSLTTTSSLLDTLTTLVAGIAAISLFVGGIGVMNIMLVSVSERTHEIGIRKAIGGTNKQLLGQFLIEAAVLSLVGGLLGTLLAGGLNIGLRVFTNLQPVITIPVILIANGVSLAVGIIFGIVPAAKAARKDPIEALRYE